MGSILSHIYDKIQEYGSLEEYQKSLISNHKENESVKTLFTEDPVMIIPDSQLLCHSE